MNLENRYNFAGIKEIIKNIIDQAEIMEESVEKMDIVIKEAIGKGGNAWQSTSAEELRNKWDSYVEEIKKYINIVHASQEKIELINDTMSEE